MHEIVIEERVSVSLFNLMYSYVMAHGATPENFIFSGMADGASNYNFNWNLIKIVALSLYGAIPDNITFSGLTPWAIPKLTLRF